jgi:DNA-binding MarR family transcriptional regulator
VTDLKLLFTDLVGVEIELWDAIDVRLKQACDLPLGRFLPMRIIAGTASCRVLDIAAGLSITVGAASKSVDRIEAAGHCLRRPNPDDRRSSIIELTAAGRSILDSATRAYESELAARLAGRLSARELATLSALVTKLRSAPPDPSR